VNRKCPLVPIEVSLQVPAPNSDSTTTLSLRSQTKIPKSFAKGEEHPQVVDALNLIATEVPSMLEGTAETRSDTAFERSTTQYAPRPDSLRRLGKSGLRIPSVSLSGI
jgi:hypothetical protein